MPVSLAIFGLIALAVIWVMWTDLTTKPRDEGGWLDDEEQAQRDLYPWRTWR